MTADPAALVALADRCEAASEGSAYLDGRIQQLIAVSLFRHYTRDLQAALALANGWSVSVSRTVTPAGIWSDCIIQNATGIIGECKPGPRPMACSAAAAALRARAQQERQR